MVAIDMCYSIKEKEVFISLQKVLKNRTFYSQ